MQVWTDSVAFADRIGGGGVAWTPAVPPLPSDVAPLVARLYDHRPIWTAEWAPRTAWAHLFVVEHPDRSQFDQLVALSRESATIPDGTLCLAGSGRGLHGQRGRSWAALAGNVHLSLWLTPPPTTMDAPLALLAMTAVAVVEAIDAVPGLAGRAGIKWVNDILIDGAKVCGILTHVARRPHGGVGIVGIGLNAEAVPDVPPTAFVPAVTALSHVAAQPDAARLAPVLQTLLGALERGYTALCRDGPADLADRYRARSLVLGRDVALCADDGSAAPPVIAEGRAVALGDELELYLAGHARPFTTGRLLLRGDRDG
jgi:BirA family transcriptional regulator, biotin operon repressor / biotin---[acetyl-CoA-carboxylase] ligase